MHDEITHLFNLKGRTALVTGGARTLGYDASAVLAAAGCNVALTSRNLKSAEAAANQLQDIYGVETLALEMDQTDFEQVAEAVRAVLAWKPQIHILINNAGGGVGESPALLFERDPKDIALMISTNLTGLLYCCREAGRHMAENGYGKIVNIASIAALCGRDRRVYARAGMKGQPVDYAAALQKAKRWVRQQEKWQSPYYWGAFVLVGPN